MGDCWKTLLAEGQAPLSFIGYDDDMTQAQTHSFPLMSHAIAGGSSAIRVPFPHQIVSFFREVLEDRFGRTWLDQPKPSHPVRSMWQQANHDPFALIDLCRLGRDIDFLREVGDPDQQLYLAKLLDRVRGDASGALNLLYELHVAMLFRPEQGAQGGLAPEPDYPGYDVLVAVSDPSRFVLANGIYTLDERKMWVSCKRINESGQYKTVSGHTKVATGGHRAPAR